MDSQHSPSGTPQQPGSRPDAPSLTRWWQRRWVPTFFSSRQASAAYGASPVDQRDSVASFEVDDGSVTPSSPAPLSYGNTNDSGVASFTAPVPPYSPVQQERVETSEEHRFASITPTTASTTATSFRLAPPSSTVAAAANNETKSTRVPSTLSLNGVSNLSVAAGSSANTTPRLSASTASTPLLLTPVTVPLSAESHTVKPRAMIGTAGRVASASSVAPSGNSSVPHRGTTAFLLPAAASVSDTLAEEQRRTPPACVELPGPQSLFIRSGAASGCDSRSIGLLQRTVLAEQHALSH